MAQALDLNDPAVLLMAAEESSTEEGRSAADMLLPILSWCCDGSTMVHQGLRLQIAVSKIRPELIEGKTMEAMGRQIGMSRAGVHKMARDFSETFQLRGLKDRRAPGDRFTKPNPYRSKKGSKRRTTAESY